MNRRLQKITGWTLILWGVYLNIPFSILAAIFDYPNILREPAAKVLTTFQAGGGQLLVAWYAFALAALLFLPVVVLLHQVLRRTESLLLIPATVAGIVAAVLQLVGLIRWVFVVPFLAATYTDAAATAATKDAALVVFSAVHQFAGVAVGEHLGQLFTAVWMLLVSLALRRSPTFGGWQWISGIIIAVVMLLGLVEGFATVAAFDSGVFALFASISFVALALWLIALGIALLRHQGDFTASE